MKLFNYENQIVALIAICFGACVVNAGTSTTEYVIPTVIKELFSEVNDTKTTNITSLPPSSAKIGNNIYAEGSSIPVKEEYITPRIKADNGTEGKVPEGMSESAQSGILDGTSDRNASSGADVKQKAKSSFLNESTSNIMLQKLSETRLNSLLDVDGFVHGGGTSSIKPRKGVSPVNVVPRKGVDEFSAEEFSSMKPNKGINSTKDESDKDADVETIANVSLPLLHSCFIAEHNKCHDVGNFKDIECTCCEVGNKLGKIISQQSLIDCSACLPINKTPVTLSQTCKNICCKNISQDVTSNNDSIVKPLSEKSHRVSEESHGKVSPVNSTFPNAHDKNEIIKPVKKNKLKPSVTHVPYNSNVSSNNLFSKSKGEKYVPIIVSIFILPLVGLTVFFLWKKTRELWERRYYKRMDFLIDGIYND